jgi:ribosomal protein S12 methylthiotransferase accessory factor
MEIYFAGNKKVNANINGFTVQTDQSPRSGGDGEHPEPFTLFLASLGTCAGIFVKFFCDQRGIDTTNIKLTQDQKYDPVRKMIGQIDIKIHVPSDFPEKYDSALIQTASLCSVKKHVREDIDINVSIARN